MFVADHHTLNNSRNSPRPSPRSGSGAAPGRRPRQAGADRPRHRRRLGCSHKAVKNWVAQYNAGGIEALHERPRSGRPPLLDPAEYPRLKQRLDAPPRPEDGVCTSGASTSGGSSSANSAC